MIKKIVVGFSLLFVPLTSIWAQETSSGEAMRVMRRHASYEVNADGTATLIAEQAMLPLNRLAVNAVGQYALSYQEGMSDIEVLEAYTLKKDGRRVDVTADKIITQVPPAYANTPMYTDMKIKRLIFPDFTVGDQVVFKYKRRWLMPQFPDHFFDAELYPKSMYFEDVRVTLKHLKSYPLLFKSRGLTELPVQEHDGFITHEWKYENKTVVPDEPGAISQADRDPGLVISSFESWSDIATAYDARARDKAAVTPEIKKLADEITKSIKGKRQQAEAIYAWVTKNIRYVAVFLGAGGYVPHTANSILENRYGDCKDYTTILGALLTAKNIDNEPVIIHAGNRYSLPETPTPIAFNHAITYLPEFKLYLDATARTLPFGVLAPIEANKSVLHTRLSPRIERTPPLPNDRSLVSNMTMTVSDDGTAKGNTEVNGTGSMAQELQSIVERIRNPQQAKQLAMGFLSLEGMTGTAEFAPMSATETATTNGYVSYFTLSNWINLPGPGAVRASTGLMSPSPLRLIATATLNTPVAKVDRVCFAGSYEENGTIKLSQNVKLANLPKGVEASNALASYRASYSQDGNTIKVSRKLDMKYPNTVCKPEETAAFREILEHVRRDTSAQMTYE